MGINFLSSLQYYNLMNNIIINNKLFSNFSHTITHKFTYKNKNKYNNSMLLFFKHFQKL